MKGPSRTSTNFAAVLLLLPVAPAITDAFDERAQAITRFTACIVRSAQDAASTHPEPDETAKRIVALCQRRADPNGSILLESDDDWRARRLADASLALSLLTRGAAQQEPMDPAIMVDIPSGYTRTLTGAVCPLD